MTNGTQYEYDIFISYNREDEAWAKHLATRLEQEVWQGRKLKVFFAPWDVKPGDSITERIEYALPRSRKVGLIVSPESVTSEWVNVERYVTHYIELTERQKRLIPLYRRACDIPPFLKSINHVDFQDDAKFAESFRILLATIKDEPLPRGEQTSSTLIASLPAAIPPAVPRPPVVGFVARRDEQGRDIVERLKAELAPQGNQLITLSGPGGIGKTTLAAEAARGLKEVFGGRIVWSSAEKRADFTLSTLHDDIATQLGHTELRTLAPDLKESQVRALVDDPQALVVLDNYETIAPEAKKRIEEWFALAQCSALFTSRHKLNSTRNIPIAAMSPDEAQEYLEKLVAETQDTPIFSDEVRQRIYETAEANPYVMQWVVAQIDAAQEPKTVLEELAHGEGDAAERVFDRSFNLPQLGEDGRATLLALSLFVPSATREALAETAGFNDDLKRVNEAIKNLRALWLIKGLDENRRFTIEGLTRSLAKARLSKDERADGFRKRFVAHFLSYAKAHARPAPEDFDALEAEKDNLMGAMDEAFRLGNWESVVQLMAAINFDGVNGFLTVRGYWDEVIRRGKQASKASHKLADQERISGFTHNLAIMYQFRGELEEARRLYNESLEIKKKLSDQRGIAGTLHNLAAIAHVQGELTEARRLYEESLEIEKTLGNQSGIASTLHELGRLAQAQGDLEEARRLYEESLEIKKTLGNQSGIAITLHALAILAKSKGELTKARQLYDESLAITKKLGDKSNIALISYNLGLLTKLEGNKTEAARLWREALNIFENLHSPYAEEVRRSLERLEREAS
ncbi:MAG TPA: tetratricopeptide repeat protein [Pyrinomonadaceae bacterium]|nr:tetratricopeptide repeat protein [Pyrinomonadaceae bacterium]